ncbi:IS66 family insertion sequence element accessory protein TnpB [Marinisporobacter balticus]|uniref:IS66 Orf2 like protein n=1 Tax=Marinisporobacter balticus TaxID=2018667 RepID=A0A4R2K436_9FIRM|nr:IS66 family insertion sequence element accessory protein TnpB [Marinisporobacter balticus]TCO67903.1 IS66 Orf2 like protein [Marinisporobacter balticus]
MFNKNRIDQVYLSLGSTDLRKSIDGLSLIVLETFKLDPFSRNLYVFCNKNRDKIKILEWDTSGFWLHYKRLEKDKFRWPDDIGGTHIAIDERSFRWLLDGLTIKEKYAHKPIEERQIF